MYKQFGIRTGIAILKGAKLGTYEKWNNQNLELLDFVLITSIIKPKIMVTEATPP